MSNLYRWASHLLSRRSASRQVKSQWSRASGKSRRLRLFETLEPRIVFASLLANSLAELRSFGLSANNDTVTLSPTGGDPHPVTGIVTPGEYWINGDHIANPTNSFPIFMDLSGTGNTYDLSGATINLDTRKLDGFGRNLGHGSGVHLLKISGSDNIVRGINLIGQDIALDTDPNAQRFADWAAVYVELTGDSNTVDGAHVVTRGSRTDAYGLGDAFGKGASGGVTPFLGHRKASAFRVGEATDAVINDMHLDVNTFGHGFFVQASTDTTLTNSTVTGELFPSTNVINHPLYQEHGVTFHQNEIPDDIMISGAEGGVRMYTGSSGLIVDNVVVTNMRTGFATSLGGGTKTLNNVEAYGVESAFGVGNQTTITNAKADGINGPIVIFDRNDVRDSSVEIELVGDQAFNHDYALAYVNGNNVDISITSDRPAEDFQGTTVFRAAQFFYDSWRETNGTTTFDVDGYDHFNSVLINDTNATLVLGEEASGNTGRSQGFVVTNGKQNDYDGISLVPAGKQTVLVDAAGLGNNGTASDGTLETNASIVADGGTLEVQPGIRISGEKLTITGDGVDGKGALYSDGSPDNGTRFGSSNSSDESTIFLDGDASIGVGVEGNHLLVGQIQGTGDLTKVGLGSLTLGKSSTFDGNLVVTEGHITTRSGAVHRDLFVASGASISQVGANAYNTSGEVTIDGLLDLNGRSDGNNLPAKIGQLLGSGQLVSTNPSVGAGGNLEIAFESDQAIFSGQISTNVALAKTGSGKQVFSGNHTYTGTTTINGGVLQVDGVHTGGDVYTVGASGTLGGNGTIDSVLIVNSDAHLAPGASAGRLSVSDVTLSPGAFFDVEIGGVNAGSEYDQLLTDSATLGGVLNVSLLQSGGTVYEPSPTNTFSIAVSSSSLSGLFDNVASGQRIETVGGEGTFLVTYGTSSKTVLLSDFEPTLLDFGDAPETYPTLRADDGARHVALGPRLGPSRDVESDGVTTVAANGDGSDEDGALFGGIGVNSTVAAVNVELAGASEARVDAWIDFNRDGVWAPSEKIIDSVLVDQSMQTINYDVPSGMTTGDTYARVRLSSVGGLSPNGLAADGEVEDYVVSISNPPVVESIVVNGDNPQRSSLDSVQVTFDQVVDINGTGGDAFQFVHTDSGDVVTAIPAIDNSGGKTVVNFSFDPSGLRVTNFGSLQNGDYQLTIDASRVTRLGVELGDGDGSAGDDYVMSAVDGLFRKFGDQTGDGSVSLTDFAAFRQTFGRSQGESGYLNGLDSDGNNTIGLADFAAFRQGFGT